MKVKKLLYLGQYNLSRIDSAPKIRTWQLYQELKELVDVDFITGLRNERRKPLLKYLLSGKLNQVDAIYLEAATSTSMETDLLILLIAKLKKIPIGIYIRDAYPLLGMTINYSIKNKLLIWGWYISIWFYNVCASILYYQTKSFAKFFKDSAKNSFLPPGGRNLDFIPLDPKSKNCLYSGGLGDIYGVTNLLEAMKQVHQHLPEVKLILVCRKEESYLLNDYLEAPWLEIKHLVYEQIIDLRQDIYMTLIPMKKDTYADSVLGIKFWDYMSLGRPIVCTNCEEMSQIIHTQETGLICESNAAAIANAIIELFSQPEQAMQMAINAYEYIHSQALWKHRAEKIVAELIPNA